MIELKFVKVLKEEDDTLAFICPSAIWIDKDKERHWGKERNLEREEDREREKDR